MRRRHFLLTLIPVIALTSLIGLVGFSTPVSAADFKSTITDKTALSGLNACYMGGAYKSSITLSDYTGSIVENPSVASINLPFGGSVNLNCSTLLSGSTGGYNGLYKASGHTPPSRAATPTDKGDFLTNMGYIQQQADAGNGKCMNLVYYSSAPSLQPDQDVQICAADVVDGKIQSGLLKATVSKLTDGTGATKQVVFIDDQNEWSIRICNYNGLFNTCKTVKFTSGTNWNDLTKDIISAISGVREKYSYTYMDQFLQSQTVDFTLEPNADRDEYSDTPYVLGGSLDLQTAAANKAIQFLSNGVYKKNADLKLSDDEKVYLMQWYLYSQVDYNIEEYGCGLTGDEVAAATGAGYQEVALYKDEAWKICYVKTKRPDRTVRVYNNGGYMTGNRTMNFADVIKELNSLKGTVITDPGSVDGSNPGNNSGTAGSDSSSITACYRNAGALGWLVCPVMEVVGKMTEGLYGYIEGNFLQVGTNLSNANGVREGWGIFRDFTNIIFTIMFLVVIISQVTGVGVSNYGIKKILPRLIVIVVMVNISFLLCQLAIDVSNILGSGLRSMFEGFATKIDSVPFNLGTVVGGITGAAFSAAGTVAVLSALSITIPWTTWLFPIFLTLLSCLVSVFFFMILLGVRQAGVIILMVLSPVAIICYALPNTKMSFDRWRKLFVSLLMVYPICGILMGGGQFASTLLLSVADDGAGGVFFTIVAMLVSVVPFFFIPSILKASMMAMGNLGMKISQFGRGIGGGITRGIRGSEIGRDIQRRANMRYADRAAAKIEKRAARLAQKNKDLSGWNRTRLGRYNATYNRLGYEDIRAGGSAERIKPGTSVYASMVENARDEQFSKEVQGKQNLIKNSGLDSVINAGNKVNGEDDAALGAELDEYLKRIINANALGYDDATVTEYVKSAQAIINTLSDRGTSGARTKVINSLSNALNANAATLMGATGSERDRLRKTFGSLASRISGKYGKAYKGDYPGASAMLGDIAKGDFSAASTFRAAKDLDIDGNVIGSHLRSTQYTGAGLDGMNTEDFSKLKTSGLSNILAGIQDGDITGEKLQEMARLADEVLNSDIYTPDGDARKYMERIRDAAFASSSVPVSGGRTAGSAVISRANSRAISSILNQVQAAADWSHLNADQQQHFGHLMSNIHESLANDSFTAGDAGQLKQTLKIGRAKNFEDASTGTIVGEFAGAPTLKITHADGGRQKVSLPAGWARDPGGRWIEVTSSGMRPLNAAEIKKAEQIETHNNQVDIDNGTV